MFHQEIHNAANTHLLAIGKVCEPFGEFVDALHFPGHIRLCHIRN
jgi:hypothetical protein